MQVAVKKLNQEALLPTYGSEGAACFDIYALEGGRVHAGMSRVFRTGLAFEIPPGWVLKIFSRSGHGFKNGVRLVNSVGIIDADYRGELMVGLASDSQIGEAGFEVKAGDRIAQGMLEPVARVSFLEQNYLSETARGAGGLGSTGA
jgi:dUTP pyrophosphatase